VSTVGSTVESTVGSTERQGASPYVIAEAGVNHDGDLAVAHALVDVAAASGADAVKFQTFTPEALVSAGAAVTPYQRRSGVVSSQAEMLAALTLPAGAWAELAAHAAERGVDFLSSPFDPASAALLVRLGVSALKVGSGELTNLPFLAELADSGLPLLVSTGMADLAEVAAAVDTVTGRGAGLSLLHCVSAYPAPVAEANLRAIPAMASRFGVPVGWSDHTETAVTAVAAVALGASLLEKHITTGRDRRGPDHAASMEPDAFTDYVAQVRSAAASLGDGVKRRMPSEEPNAPLVRRSWHAVRDLPAGTAVAAGDVVALRPETGVPASVDVTGRVLRTDVAAGAPVLAEDLAP
jgi:N,N'-diacetyllegionaminate synthase